MATEPLEKVGKEPLTRTIARKPIAFIPQLTPTDCGAASLASVLALFGKHVPIHEIRATLGGGRNGVTAKQLLTAARAFGLSARGVAIEPSKLRYLPPGSILHWDLAHFVVYESSNAKFVNIVDPGAGRRRVPMDEAAKSLSGVALVFEPGQDFVPEAPKRQVRFKRYASWMLSARKVWGRILTISFFMQLLALSVPGLMAILVDKVVPRADTQLLYLVGAGFLMIASFQFLSVLLRARLLLELRTKVEARMSFDFVEHLFSLPYAFFQQRTTGDLMMRMSSQISIREVLTSGALSAILDGALVSLYFVLLLGAAPGLALVALGFAGMQVALYLLAARRSSLLVVEGLAAQSQLEAYQVEMLAGIETVKSMGATDRSFSRWSDLYVNTLNRSITRERLEGTFGSLLTTLRFCGPVCLMLAGASKVLDGSLSLGTMLGLSALGSGFLEPVSNLVGTCMKLTQLRAYMERIEDVLETPSEPRRSLSAQERAAAASFAGSIHVSDLSFRYPSEPKPTLQHIAFTADPGECVAIVGPSGSGKSTLARLLAGLYEPLSGSIAFDGRDMRIWDLHALREKLGIVTQDTRLFSGTIRDNVTLFDASIPPEEVEAACRKACLDGAIQQMPMGYDTLLADGGSSLSGGQRQRLSLARALVRKPSVLILDEATSALDVITERAVQDNLRELRCTRVIVAHRLSTVVEADKIMVLEEGKLVGVGRHQDLVARCATYRELVHSQSEAAGSSTLLSAEREAGLRRPVRGVTATLVSLANAKAPGTGPFAVAAASASQPLAARPVAEAAAPPVRSAAPSSLVPSFASPAVPSVLATPAGAAAGPRFSSPHAGGATVGPLFASSHAGGTSAGPQFSSPHAPGASAGPPFASPHGPGATPASPISSPAALSVPATHQLAVSADRPAAGGTEPAIVLPAQASAPPSAAPEPAPAAVGARTIAGVAGPMRQNTVAAADDGSRVKWGKPTAG